VRGVTFFQRIKTPFTEGPADEQARLQPRMRQIGEMLQERREDLGLDLDEIGAMLRIKPGYLAALEQGRPHDLPGPTYAIGFVRAYADFLGLDSEAVLVRFKAEGAGLTARPDLALPVPLGERSLPGGALVLVALIVALCGYGIWYYLSTEARDRPERVAAVPSTLVPSPSPGAAAASSADNTSARKRAELARLAWCGR
jgi:cytoskeletal protein RodZ